MPYDDSNEVHSEIYKGFHISIKVDTDPQNPREEYDHIATMICFHRRYILGDEHTYDNAREAVSDITGIDVDDLPDDIGEALKDFYWLPLHLYDHSGITMNTTGFSCPFDSGQVGIIYIPKATAHTEWPFQPDETKEARDERILTYMRNEVEEYDNYLTGTVYGYVLSTVDEDEEPDEELDNGSCWGFAGDYEENALKEAKELIDGLHER